MYVRMHVCMFYKIRRPAGVFWVCFADVLLIIFCSGDRPWPSVPLRRALGLTANPLCIYLSMYIPFRLPPPSYLCFTHGMCVYMYVANQPARHLASQLASQPVPASHSHSANSHGAGRMPKGVKQIARSFTHTCIYIYRYLQSINPAIFVFIEI